MTTSFQRYSRAGWLTLIKNLTVYGGQPIDAVMGAEALLAEIVNTGLLDRYKSKS
ncbi:hypothetical protein ACEUCJ_15170 [Aeromonas rivipollensis]|uniref:hypothetical protein n=1 Tax=Aeromonas rivipollensis TaxID=948519 RepID=UPI0038D1D13A